MFKKIFIGICVVILVAVGVWAASPPTLMNYQGKLTDANNVPVDDGSFSIVFSIYNVPTSGTALWTETRSVTTESGFFNVLLGENTAIDGDIFATQESLYIGIKVGADAEMTPRQRIVTAGYAFNADTLDGYDSTDFITSGSLGNYVELGPLTRQTTSAVYAVSIESTNASGTGIYAEADQYGGYFIANGTNGNEYGLFAKGYYGVKGEYKNDANVYGVLGNYSPGVAGVYAQYNSNIYSRLGGSNYAVYGQSNSNYAGWFVNSGTNGYGVYASTSGQDGDAVWGTSSGIGGQGVHGVATNTSATENYGGYFIAQSETGAGVYGSGQNQSDIANYGGYFITSGYRGRAVYGYASYWDAYQNYGGYFAANGDYGVGVLGKALDGGDFINYGGSFEANGDQGRGVSGTALSTGGTNPRYGGYFTAKSSSYGYGLVATNEGGNGNSVDLASPTHAGYFRGDVNITGSMTAISLYGDGSTLTGVATSGDLDTYVLKTGDEMSGILSVEVGSSKAYLGGTSAGVRGEGAAIGIQAYTAGSGGVGVYSEATGEGTVHAVDGQATNTGDYENYGGYFQADGSQARGVFGFANNNVGTNYGGYFRADGYSGAGVYGVGDYAGSFLPNVGGYFVSKGNAAGAKGISAEATGADANFGGFFVTKSSAGMGLYATSEGSGFAASLATPGWAGYFEGPVNVVGSMTASSFYYDNGTSLEGRYVEFEPTSKQTASGDNAIWVQGTGSPSYVVSIEASADGTAVFGKSFNGEKGTLGDGVNNAGVRGDGTVYGVYGRSNNASSYGVYGESGAVSSYGLYGSTGGDSSYGVYGVSTGAAISTGVYGSATNTSANVNYGGRFSAAGINSYAVYGNASNASGNINYGGHFSSAGTQGAGVYGFSAYNYGGQFMAGGLSGIGLYAKASGSTGFNYGAYIATRSWQGTGLLVSNEATTGNNYYVKFADPTWAGNFSGPVNIDGDLNVTGVATASAYYGDGQYLTGISSGLTTAEADDRYVNETGDTMIGDLTIEADLYVTGTIEGGSPVKVVGGLDLQTGTLEVAGGEFMSDVAGANGSVGFELRTRNELDNTSGDNFPTEYLLSVYSGENAAESSFNVFESDIGGAAQYRGIMIPSKEGSPTFMILLGGDPGIEGIHLGDMHNNNTIIFRGTLEGEQSITIRSKIVQIDSATIEGHFIPSSNNNYDLGQDGAAWNNVWAQTYYGDGSNLTGILTSSEADDYYVNITGDTMTGILTVSSSSIDRGVHASATQTGAVVNYGGYFEAGGNDGYAVFADAAATGAAVKNYGGGFLAQGDDGVGVWGRAPGNGANNGGYFWASGSSGRGVYGRASNSNGTIYGGYFTVNSENGYGLLATNEAALGDGNYAQLASGSWAGYFNGPVNVAGTLTATSSMYADAYYGDGSNLTGISGGGGISTAEADGRYVNETGDTMIGDLTIEADLYVTGTIEGGSPVKMVGGLNLQTGSLEVGEGVVKSAAPSGVGNTGFELRTNNDFDSVDGNTLPTSSILSVYSGSSATTAAFSVVSGGDYYNGIVVPSFKGSPPFYMIGGDMGGGGSVFLGDAESDNLLSWTGTSELKIHASDDLILTAQHITIDAGSGVIDVESPLISVSSIAAVTYYGDGSNLTGIGSASGYVELGPTSVQSTTSVAAISVEASGTGAIANYGGYFTAAGNFGRGVYGHATSVTGFNYGGEFLADGDNGVGVEGKALGSNGKGVYAVAGGTSGRGVEGYASSIGAISNYGGYFRAAGNFGRAVYGHATSVTGFNYGGEFKSNSPDGYGIFAQNNAGGWAGYFDGPVNITGTLTAGGLLSSSEADDLYVNETGDTMTGMLTIEGNYYGLGVTGAVTAIVGTAGENWGILGNGFKGYGVHGSGRYAGGVFFASLDTARAVEARATSVTGTTYGGHFSTVSPSGIGASGYGGSMGVRGEGYSWGVYGVNKNNTNSYGYLAGSIYGVYGSILGTGSYGGLGAENYGAVGHAGIDGNAGGLFTTAATQATGVIGGNTATGDHRNRGGSFYSYADRGRGVEGQAISATGVNYGGYFWTNSADGYGLLATNEANGDYVQLAGPYDAGVFKAGGTTGRGVSATSNGSSGIGVEGRAYPTTIPGSTTYGGYFISNGQYGAGVYGIAPTILSGERYGGHFVVTSSGGIGLLATNEAVGAGNYGLMASDNYGVFGVSVVATGEGVYGWASGADGKAVRGYALDPSSVNYGVYGETASTTGYGTYGRSTSLTRYGYLGGGNYGTYGQSSSTLYGYLGGGNYGAYGQSSATRYGYLGGGSYGVFGSTEAAAGIGVGGYGAAGVYGKTLLATTGHGVYGESSTSARYGYLGGPEHGAYGQSSFTTHGILGANLGGANYLGVYGQYDSNIRGWIGSSTHAVFGEYTTARYGYLGGPYGAYGQYSSTNWGYLGGDGYGARAQGNLMGGRFEDTDQSTYAYLAYGLNGLYTDGYIVSAATYSNTTGSAANMYVDSNGLFHRSTSSKRYKTDIKDYEFNRDKLMALRPVTFKMNEKSAIPGEEGFGLIAEEVEKVFPELVTYDKEGRPDGVQYSLLAVMLLKAYQEKENDAQAQSATISGVSENANLKSRIVELESKLESVLKLLDQKADRVETEPISMNQ
jgi:endosialidase-like protein